VLEVGNGRELGDLLSGIDQVELVVSDDRMPGGRGLAALATFRQRNATTPS
jgi:CheY-like chemotaxis protein